MTMTLRACYPFVAFSPRLRCVIAGWLALLAVAVRLTAADSYLAAKQVDGLVLLPPPPVAESAEQAADLASAQRVFHAAAPEEKMRAETNAALTIFKFTPVIGPFFQPGNLPKTEALFDRVKASIKEPVHTAKEYWKRARPCQVDAGLKYGKAENSFSYPSGHSTVGTVQALVLAKLFPDQRDVILGIGRQIGWDRVMIGKHFPTDIYAGRTLAQAIVRELDKSLEFQHDLAAAKAELKAAREAAAATK